MKRLLLLPYLITSLVVYTAFVFYHLPIMDDLPASHWARRFAYQFLNLDLLKNAWWCVITITGLVAALVATEW